MSGREQSPADGQLMREADQSPGAALSRTLVQLPEDADLLLRGRVRIITYVFPRYRINASPKYVSDQ